VRGRGGHVDESCGSVLVVKELLVLLGMREGRVLVDVHGRRSNERDRGGELATLIPEEQAVEDLVENPRIVDIVIESRLEYLNGRRRAGR
jgi:hypothetical protein